MRVLIIAFHPRTMTPYSKLYEDTLKENNVEYDIIFWDRFSNGELEHVGNEYIIHKICTLGGNRLKKIIPMYNFRKVILNIISQNTYDRIIILNTLPAVLINDILLRKYQGNYVLDIRDYTYEKYSFYKNIVDKLIADSAFSTISSDGFRDFLADSDKLYVNHNISNIDAINKGADDRLSCKKNINIGYVGVVRFQNENLLMIEALKNNKQYKFSYYGYIHASCDMPKIIENKKYNNVSFNGAFNNDDKPMIYQTIDIVNAMYTNKDLNSRLCLPNRLYDCLIFKKPIIVPKGTYCARIVEQYNLGIAVDETVDIKKAIMNYINKFDSKKFNANSEQLLQKIFEDQKLIKDKIKALIE